MMKLILLFKDNLNTFEYGRRPVFSEKGRRPKFSGKGRRPKFSGKGRRPYFFEMGNDFIKIMQPREIKT